MEVFFMNKKKQNNYYNKSVLITNVLWIGFFGGVFASLFGIIAYYFRFMDFSPKFILTSWSNLAWINAWQGALITILLFGIFSIVWAFIYYMLLKKLKSMIAYILFGIVCWGFLLFVFNPMFSDLPALSKMSTNSIITSICIFTIYGVFVGYSISFDYQEYVREQEDVETEPSS